LAKDPFEYLKSFSGQAYGGESVTQLEHALQTSALASAAGASDALILASLLHDIGHLLPESVSNASPSERGHAVLGARFLGRFYEESVTEPVRLHVMAKRYLARDEAYHDELSEESRRSLVRQGGVLAPWEAEGFLGLPWAEEALLLRGWCDQAKIPGRQVPTLANYLPLEQTLRRPIPLLNVDGS